MVERDWRVPGFHPIPALKPAVGFHPLNHLIALSYSHILQIIEPFKSLFLPPKLYIISVSFLQLRHEIQRKERES